MRRRVGGNQASSGHDEPLIGLATDSRSNLKMDRQVSQRFEGLLESHRAKLTFTFGSPSSIDPVRRTDRIHEHSLMTSDFHQGSLT